MIVLLVMTDGRDHLRGVLARATEALGLDGLITRVVIHDDTGDAARRDALSKAHPGALVIGADQRLGFGGAIRNAWAYLRTEATEPFVFHLEDDFLLTRPVDLTAMCDVLVEHPYLAQLALRRQPWNAEERAAGGIVEQHPDDYTEVTDGEHVWLEHRRFFTTNPSLYRRSLLYERSWPNCRHSEGLFTHELLTDPDVRFGFWGARESGEWCHHVGVERLGVGY